MFQYFPGNYMWSLAVNRCLAGGGLFGEIHWALKDLAEAAKIPPQGDTESWTEAWVRLAVQTEATGRTAFETGHLRTARAQMYRATQYYQWAEAFLDPANPRASFLYAKHLNCFRVFAETSENQIGLFDVPFLGSGLAAYFVKG
jgi:hypothetical protein